MESNQTGEKLTDEVKALVRQGRYDDALLLGEQWQASEGGERKEEWDAVRANLVRTRDDVTARLVAQIRSQLDRGAVEQAQQSIVALSKIQPEHSEIAELSNKLATMRMVSGGDKTRVLAPKSNAEIADQPSVQTPFESSTTNDQKDQDSMNGLMDNSMGSKLIGAEESGAAIQVQTPIPLMDTSLLGLMEKLQTWQSILEKPTAVIPTAEEIHAFRQALAALEEKDREAADQLERTLQHRVVTPIITKRKNEVNESLTKLSTLRGGRDTWNDLAERAVRMLEQVSQLTGQDDTVQTDRLRQELQRLVGETWLDRAEGILRNGMAAVQLLESRNETAIVVSEAKNIQLKLDRLNREARDTPLAEIRVDLKIRIAPEIAEKIGQLRAQADDFYDVKRRQYEGAVTADIEKDYELALTDLEFVRAREGTQARVRYFPEEQSEAHQATHVPIDQAIRVCKLRWSRDLEPRARDHVDRAKDYLEQGNPNAALDELQRIVREDILPESRRNAIGDIRRKTETELGKWQEFHRAIDDVSSIAPALEGWSHLMETGKAYERFQTASAQWREARQMQADKVQAEAFSQLKIAIQTLIAYEEKVPSQQRLEECGASAKHVSDALKPWGDDFKKAITNAHFLSQLAVDLRTKFEQLKLQLRGRQLSDMEETLNAVEASVKTTRGQLAKELAGDLQVPREYHRMRDVFDLYRRADELLDRLSRQVKATEQVTRLNSLREEIKDHTMNVDDRYRGDFEKLAQYADARYHFYAGFLILNQAGDPEKARSELTEAAQHDEFRARAQAEMADIERRLAPAERSVAEALGKMDRLTQQAQWWDAYREGVKVEQEPVQKSLRQRLAEKIGICHDKALAESLGIIQQAIRTRDGDPTLLRDHAARLVNLDARRMAELKSDIWLLIHVLETDLAVQSGRWLTAHGSIQEAIKMANDKQDAEQVQGLKTRAEAIEKQCILSMVENLETPALAVQELDTYLVKGYAQDADLLMMLVEFTVKMANGAGHQIDSDPDGRGGEQSDMTAFRQAHERLLGVQSKFEQAVRIAETWRMMGQCPAYEQQRVRLLGRYVEEVTSERLQKTQELRQRLVVSKKLIHAKLSIVQQIQRALMSGAQGV